MLMVALYFAIIHGLLPTAEKRRLLRKYSA